MLEIYKFSDSQQATNTCVVGVTANEVFVMNEKSVNDDKEPIRFTGSNAVLAKKFMLDNGNLLKMTGYGLPAVKSVTELVRQLKLAYDNAIWFNTRH